MITDSLRSTFGSIPNLKERGHIIKQLLKHSPNEQVLTICTCDDKKNADMTTVTPTTVILSHMRSFVENEDDVRVALSLTMEHVTDMQILLSRRLYSMAPKYGEYEQQMLQTLRTQVPSACHRCDKRIDHLKGCGDCRSVKYCSTECQRADWDKHKPLCQYIAKQLNRLSRADRNVVRL